VIAASSRCNAISHDKYFVLLTLVLSGISMYCYYYHNHFSLTVIIVIVLVVAASFLVPFFIKMQDFK
jgi:hypothetical protein